MTKLPSLTHKKLHKILTKQGFEKVRQKGSHQVYQRESDGKMTVVPAHNRAIGMGLLKNNI